MKKFFIGLVAALLCSVNVHAAVVVSENFDSYADTLAMQANWGNSGLGTLDTSQGNGGNSGAHPGGAVNSWQSSFSVTPTATEYVVLTADIFNDGTSTNKRMTVGLRNGADPLFEMGFYNGTAEHFHVRVLGMYGNESWVPLSSGLLASAGNNAGWDRWEATFTDTQLTVTLDLGADGSIDGTFTSVGTPSANPFVDLRFGGPSNLSSGGGGANFDNIVLQTVAVPEPTSLVGLALGFVPFLRRRRTQ